MCAVNMLYYTRRWIIKRNTLGLHKPRRRTPCDLRTEG